MKRICIASPAKINRTLFIGEIQKNGLHRIESEMQKITLCDDIVLQWNTEKKEKSISFSLINPNKFDVPSDDSNIATQAADMFLRKVSNVTLSILLTKNIPSGAGLGGGSSNAASTLLGLQKLFPEAAEDIFEIGKSLGSDIPFFLEQSSRAMARETGEQISPLPKKESCAIVLVKPHDTDISTQWAYKKWDQCGKKGRTNDFESVVFLAYPQLQEISETLKSSGAFEAQLCGSGSAIYGLFQNKETALSAAGKFDSKTYWRWTGKTSTKN